MPELGRKQRSRCLAYTLLLVAVVGLGAADPNVTAAPSNTTGTLHNPLFDLPIPEHEETRSDNDRPEGPLPFGDPSRIEIPGPVKFDQEVSVGRGDYILTLEATLAPSEFVYIEVVGFGELHFKFGQTDPVPSSNPPTLFTVPMDSGDETTMVPLQTPQLRTAGQTLTLFANMEFSFLKFTLRKASHFKTEFNSSLRFYSKFAHEIKFLVQNPEHFVLDNENRIQFMVSSTLESQDLTGEERLEMYINQGAEFPSPQKHDTTSSGIFGNGLVETITKGDKLFCKDAACGYAVLVEVKGIDGFNWFPSLLANKAKVSFKRMASVLEELEPGKDVEYQMEVVGSQDSWLLTISPFFGSVELYVNEDTEPAKPAQAKYYAYSNRKENLIITSQEQEASVVGLRNKVFWVRFSNPDFSRPTTFQFKMQRYPTGMPIDITENTSQSGALVKGEVVSMLLSKRQKEQELVKLELRLEVLSGSADMMLKTCPLPNVPCVVTASDFEDYKMMTPEEASFQLMRMTTWNPASKIHFINQKVRCVNSETFDGAQPGLNDGIPLSMSCNFAIGVRSLETDDKQHTKFKFVAYGAGLSTPILPGTATLAKVSPKEVKRFELNAGPAVTGSSQKIVKLNIVAMTGSCFVLGSKTSRVPTQGDNDVKIMISNENVVSLRTQTYSEEVTFPAQTNSTQNDILYIAVEGLTFCSLDITPMVLLDDGNAASLEVIPESKLLHRQITEQVVGTELDSKTGQKRIGFARKFVYSITEKVAAIQNNAQVHFTVDSPILGLRICIQAHDGRDQPFYNCKLVSKGSTLTADKIAVFSKGVDSVIVSVQKVVPEKEFVKLPIDFTLKITTDDYFEPIELDKPGHSHTFKLHRGISQDFFIDLVPFNSMASLMFESADPQMRADLSIATTGKTWSLGRLNADNFGIDIRNLRRLKSTNCTNVCNLVISVYTESLLSERFTLTYQRDDVSLILKEGEQLAVPNCKPIIAVFESDGNNPISFSVHNDIAESAIMAKLVNPEAAIQPVNLIMEITSLKFDFKTNIETNPEITVPLTSLKQNAANAVAFFIRPIFRIEMPKTANDITIYGPKQRGTVHLHAKLLKLKPFFQVKRSITIGDTAYFQVELDTVEDFSLILTVSSGQAAMFINRGDHNLPTIKKFWRKSTNLNGDEIVVTKADIAKDAGNSNLFYVGVTGVEAAKYSLLFLPNFKNLIKVSFQHLMDLKLEEGKNYYFDYLNTHDEYSTLFYAEGSDVEVSALNFDKFETDFVSMTTDESNYHQRFTLKKEDIPRKREFHRPVDNSTTTIVRVKAINGPGRVNFAIYDTARPLEVPTEKRFRFTQEKGDNATFMARLGDAYDEVDVHFRLEHGEVTLYTAETMKAFGEGVHLKGPSEKSITFKIGNLEKASDILIFRNVFLKVVSEGLSRYSVLLLPKDKFRQVKAFEPEVITTSTNKDTYLYFHITPQMAKSVHNLVIEVTRPETFDDKPDLLFVADSDVVLTADTPFLPMPINDIFERQNGEFIHIEVRPETRVGFYVLRVAKTDREFPLKVGVSFNDMKNIEVNSIHKGAIPAKIGKGHEYSMFIPEAGEVRLLIESCNDLRVETARFYGEEKLELDPKQEDKNQYIYDEKTQATEIKFDQRFAQSSPYLRLSTTRLSKTAEVRDLTSKIVRAFISCPGIFKFRVVRAEDSISEEVAGAGSQNWFGTVADPDPTYVVMSEFRPNNIELILKDYIQLFNSSEDLKNLRVVHRQSRRTGDIHLSTRVPKFKPQFLVDYPDAKFAVMKFSFYVFSDPAFDDKLVECGTACLDSVPHYLKVHTVNFTQQDIQSSHFNNTLDVTLEGSEIEDLHVGPVIQVFCLVSVHWYNNEGEANNISLNPKYTHVPYFLTSFPYREQSALYLFILAGVALSVLVFGCYMWCVRRKAQVVIKEYRQPGSGASMTTNPSLEISSISKSEWRDERL